MIKSIKQNAFYIASLIFAASLPFSLAMISISVGLLVLASVFQLEIKTIKYNFRKRNLLLLISGIFLIYILWLVPTNDWQWAIYDLRKNVTYLVVPFAFLFAPKLSENQYKSILYVFTFSVIFSALITFIRFYSESEHTVLKAQHYGFLHHIRFSLEVIFAMVILVWVSLTKTKTLNKSLKLGIVLTMILLVAFLIWHQSLTGIFTFLGALFIATIMGISYLRNRKVKRFAGLILFLIVAVPIAYLYYAVNLFYSVEEIEPGKLEKFTAQGNPYHHNINSKIIENGHYVWLYVSEKELEAEWNKRSDLKYNTLDKHGYEIKHTLIRYLTSKNLRKDAEGVKALSEEDIKNIENGISNYILANRKVSIYPRIYVSIWELDTYLKTGVANHRSLAQRIEYTNAALAIIKENFWMGVGTGNWKKAYRDHYIENESQMEAARYGNVHNQYLNYMVKFGLVGFLLIMFAIIYPVVKTKAYKNPLFFLFLVIMFIGNLGDANFETHTGANFFVFFYCLFFIQESGK